MSEIADLKESIKTEIDRIQKIIDKYQKQLDGMKRFLGFIDRRVS